MRRILPLLLCPVISLSCAVAPVNDNGGYVIRYVNMQVIYGHEISLSNEAVQLRSKREALLKKIRDREAALYGKTGEKPDEEILHYRGELAKIEEQQEKLKSQIYTRIKKAVEAVAAKYEVDFLLGTGEGVVYSRPLYDLTPEVLTELDRMRKNSSPVWK